MFAILIAVAVSAGGGILAYLFRDTVLAFLFTKPSDAQAAVNQQRAMDQAVIDSPDQAKAVQELKDGSA